MNVDRDTRLNRLCGKLGGMLEKSSDDFEISALQKALCYALKGLSPEEQYAKARPIQDFKAWEEAAKTLGAKWLEEVMAYAK